MRFIRISLCRQTFYGGPSAIRKGSRASLGARGQRVIEEIMLWLFPEKSSTLTWSAGRTKTLRSVEPETSWPGALETGSLAERGGFEPPEQI